VSYSDERWTPIEDGDAGILAHPFSTCLTDGALPEESLRFSIVQGSLYLREYARVQASRPAGPPRPSTRSTSRGSRPTSSPPSRRSTPTSSPRRVYGGGHPDIATRADEHRLHDVRAPGSRGGTLAEEVSAVLPRARNSLEVGRELSLPGSPHPLYQRRIDLYGEEDHGRPAQVAIGIADELDQGARMQGAGARRGALRVGGAPRVRALGHGPSS